METSCPASPSSGMVCASVELLVPSNRLSCADWIKEQNPLTVADCLDAAQASYNALTHELAQGEAARLSQELALAQAELRECSRKYRQELAEHTEAVRAEEQMNLSAHIGIANAEREELNRRWQERLAQLQADQATLTESAVASAKALLFPSIQLLEERNKELQESLKKETQRCQERLAQLEEEREASVASAVASARASLACTIQLLEEQVAEARAQRAAEKEAAEEKWRAEVQDAASRIQRQADELRSYEERKAVEIAELKERLSAEKDYICKRYAEQVEHAAKEQRHQLELKEVAAKEQNALISQLWASISAKEQAIAQLNSDLRDAAREKEETVAQMSREKEAVLAQYESFASTFRGSAATIGKLGEDFVARVHSSLNLGTLEDTSRIRETGWADALWVLELPHVRKLRALVEVKHVAALHSVHDIAKFEADVSEASKRGTANAAVLFSLSARIPGARQIDLRLKHGIPVLRVSRDAEDTLSARALVELGFSTLAEAWPLIQASKGETTEEIIRDVTAFIDDQLEKASKLSKPIRDLEKQARALSKIAGDLKKQQESMLQSMETLRLQYPQLSSDADSMVSADVAVNPWSDPRGAELIELFLDIKNRNHGRYPTDLAKVEMSDVLRQFCLDNDISAKNISDRAKQAVPRGAKRARTSDVDGGSATAAAASAVAPAVVDSGGCGRMEDEEEGSSSGSP